MQLVSRLRMAGAAVAAVAIAAGGVAAFAAPVSAQAEGPAGHFVVLGPLGNLSDTQRSVAAAGGQILVSYPKIGVIVVKSTDADFAKNVRGMDGVQSAGASRALAEFLPAGAAGASVTEADKSVEKTSGVVGAQAGVAAAGADEPLAANQWDMRQIKADKANDINQGSPNVLVGVLDTGIEPTHPDLVPNLDTANSVGCADEGVADPTVDGWKAIGWDHGTHVAGTIAAAKNGIGIAGVAPKVKIASVKVTDEDGYIYPEYAICGFMWAAEKGFDVTNNSYFVDPWYRWCNGDPDQKAGFEAVQRAIDYSAKKDVVNVAALGNSNWDLSHDILDEGSPNNHPEQQSRLTDNSCHKLPAEVRGVVGVSSVGPDKGKSYFSNYGVSDTEVAAPGGDRFDNPGTPDGNGRVLSAVFNGGWGYKQGTSMASPHAAGVVALIRSAHPDWSAGKVIGALQGQADRQPCPANPYNPNGTTGAWTATCEGGTNGGGFYGAGLVDALDAVTK